MEIPGSYWRSSLVSFLCPEHREAFAQFNKWNHVGFGWPSTGEVTKGDALIYTLITIVPGEKIYYSQHPWSIPFSSISHKEKSLMVEELAEITRKTTLTILARSVRQSYKEFALSDQLLMYNHRPCPVAQWTEHQPSKLLVVRSNPLGIILDNNWRIKTKFVDPFYG